jgi:sigma-B regulation protein RsbU (phosphoserine phosphatase)
VATLTDYLDLKTLQQLQDAFAVVARLPIRLCGPDEKALTKPSPITPGFFEKTGTQADHERQPTRQWCNLPVMVEHEIAGKIVLDCPGDPPTLGATAADAAEASTRLLRYMGLMANVVSRMCDREKQLRLRVEELAVMYRLTAEFTSRRDLQALLDLVASTVVEVLKVKACSIRLLSEDHKELLIKAVANMSPEYLNKGAILVSESVIDSQVLGTKKPVYIADERNDPRVLYSAQAKSEGIVSALCAPLVYKGHAEGVIHVYTGKRHKFDWFEESLLLAIAGEAAAAIVNSRLYQEAVRSADMKRQLSMAGEVQRRMIPSAPPAIDGFQIGTIYVPTYELGGDFFDFLDFPGGSTGFVICDVVGKGVRASLLMASIRASLRAHASSIYRMADVIAAVNGDLCRDVLTSDFATMFYGVLDQNKKLFTYVNAGHPQPMLLRAGQAWPMSTGGMIIGIDPAARYQYETLALRSGDVILAFTDGIFEAMNFADEPFGRQRVEQAAIAAIGQGQSAEGIVRHVLWEMRRFAGLQTLFDDLTLLAIKVL